jgi:endonuclease/exonuclease/phosphatase family metal-dependent hydrolase
MAGLLVAVTAVTAGAAAPAGAAPRPGDGTPVTVMTRNVYLGGDIGRPLRAVQRALETGQDPVAAFIAGNTALRQVVDATDFPARSKQLARELATRRPELVGLQEVAWWRQGPIGVAHPTATDYDFLQTLLADVAALGEPYEVVVSQTESDVEGPAFIGGVLRNARLTIRDVVLRRLESGVKVLDTGGAQYDTRITYTFPGATVSFIRGHAWADMRAGAKRFRFINTHLESQFSSTAYDQARELLDGPAATAAPVILVCDCNSDPLNQTIKPGDTRRHAEPYELITGEGGFTDTWLEFAPAEAGWTSGLSELVNDTAAQAAQRFDHRIDMVFARGPAGGGNVSVDRGWVVGRDPAERTPTGLWPSDHAGVVMRLRP